MQIHANAQALGFQVPYKFATQRVRAVNVMRANEVAGSLRCLTDPRNM